MVIRPTDHGIFASSAGGATGAGYFGGGLEGSYVATVDKFAFPDDSRTTLGTGLSVAELAPAAMANSGTAGYFGGGWDSAQTDTVDKFAFSDDSRTTLGTGLSAPAYALAGMANSGTAGYFSLASTDAGVVATVDKFAFSDDSRTTLGTGVSSARYYPAGMANSGTAGYFGGGNVGVTSSYSDDVDKFAFSDDSRTTLATGLSTYTRSLAAMANSGTAGYFGGGYTGGGSPYADTVDKFAFSDDSQTTLGTGLSSTRQNLAGMADSGTAGYFGGGSTGSLVDTVDKFAFSDDSRTTLGTGLSAARSHMAGMANTAGL